MTTVARIRLRAIVLVAITSAACNAAQQQDSAAETPRRSIEGYERGGEDMSGPYEVVPNWPQPLDLPGLTWGRTAAVYAESPDRVFRGSVEHAPD